MMETLLNEKCLDTRKKISLCHFICQCKSCEIEKENDDNGKKTSLERSVCGCKRLWTFDRLKISREETFKLVKLVIKRSDLKHLN